MALFLKDLFYLQARLAKEVIGGGDPSAQRGAEMLGQILQAFAQGIDKGVPELAEPEYERWVAQALKDMGTVQGDNPIFMQGFRTGIGMLSPSFRKAVNPAGKEYQAYLVQRDWAELDAAGFQPKSFDNQQHYGEYLYLRFARYPYYQAKATYESMCDVLGREKVEAAAEKVRLAPKTATKNLVAHVPRPVKRGPGGMEVEDHDVPFPPGVIGVYTNQLVAMQVLATHDTDLGYLLYLLAAQYQSNKKGLDPAINRWTYARQSADALKLAFGEATVIDAAKKSTSPPNA